MSWQGASKTGDSARLWTPAYAQVCYYGRVRGGLSLKWMSQFINIPSRCTNITSFPSFERYLHQHSDPNPLIWGWTGGVMPRESTQTRLTFRVQVDPTQIPLIFFLQFFLTFRFLQKRQLWLIRPSDVCPSTSCLRHPGGGGIIDDGLTHSDNRSQMTNIWHWRTAVRLEGGEATVSAPTFMAGDVKPSAHKLSDRIKK